MNGAATEGDWLVAEAQTAGRGRQGRSWSSPPGNLYASTLVTLCEADPPPATLALVAAVALWDAIGSSELRIKWPNDLMAGAAKLSGILLERQGNAVVIGFGVNLQHAPELPDRPTSTLRALGVDRTPQQLVDKLGTHLARLLVEWRAHGLTRIVALWLERAHPFETPLIARLPNGEAIEGRFDGLTSDCALRLRLADGATRVIHAADVFPLEDSD